MALVLSAVGFSGSPAGATLGPSNNFGSDSTWPEQSEAIYLNDGPIVEWSAWWAFVTWSPQVQAQFKEVFTAAFEYYEPLDVTVNRGADNSTQDLRVVPVAAAGPVEVLAVTTCITPGATIYGTHHHRVCDRKQMTVYPDGWNEQLPILTRALRHEFGHAIGLRHSNAPCPNVAPACRGVSATGEPQWNTHTQPGTDSLMYSRVRFGADTLNLQDAGNINAHY